MITQLSTKTLIKILGAASLTLVALTGCMTPEEVAALDASLDVGASGSVPNIPSPPVGPSCFNERFVQPEAQISRSIDVLFVMDTSGSMDDNRAKVADGISAFVSELPAGVDYQIGVMLAHGSHSALSGKMFKYGSTSIFSSKTTSVSTISSQLKTMVLHAPADSGIEQGEEGSYSLIKGVTTNLDANRAAGFFRTDAALAVVFVSDENDICAPYANMTTQPGLTSAEKTLRNRDCKGGIATSAVISAVKGIQGDRPYMFGAVTHKTLGYSDAGGNDSYGYGYMEVVQATNGVSTEINDGSYTTGLASMGQMATVKLNLILDYTLAHDNVDASTLKAYVDGVSVGMMYDPLNNDVHLSSGGTALSVIDLNYCINQAIPTGTGGDGTGTGGTGTGGTGTGGTGGTGGGTDPNPTPTPTPTPTFIPPVS